MLVQCGQRVAAMGISLWQNGHFLAVGAAGGSRLLPDVQQLIHALEHKEKYQCGDEEVEDGTAEVAGELGNVGHGVLRRAGDGADDGVDEVLRQRGDDAGESGAYQHADGHVHDVAAQRKGLKFIKELFHYCFPA